MANRARLEAQGVDVGEWARASKGKSLPERVLAEKSAMPFTRLGPDLYHTAYHGIGLPPAVPERITSSFQLEARKGKDRTDRRNGQYEWTSPLLNVHTAVPADEVANLTVPRQPR